MILGIGTDIVAYARIEAMHARYGLRFAQRVLSAAELPHYQNSTQPVRLLMKRFAAKEALAKAAGSGLRHPVTLRRISVTHDALGKPVFEFETELGAHLKKLGVTCHHLSISDEREHAVAFVVLEKD
ncbi:holo-[acyl-carrier protein] synthase [Gammaproteobacteria bacterium]|nr:holo-[acyl-carrier protein] synthase [Gammaproteobacteria bacterium]